MSSSEFFGVVSVLSNFCGVAHQELPSFSSEGNKIGNQLFSYLLLQIPNLHMTIRYVCFIAKVTSHKGNIP